MKSKISIDVDWDNQPIIKIEYEDSPDVRDKLVKVFLETFGGSSCWANFSFDISAGNNHRAKIRPIKPSEMHKQTEMFNKTAEGERLVTNNKDEHI